MKAQYHIALCYDEGKGIVQDYQKAVEWYSKAAEQDYHKAQSRLAMCYYKGNGVEQNYQKAIEWFEKGSRER